MTPVRCSRCGLPCAAWTIRLRGQTFCTAFCVRQVLREGEIATGTLPPEGQSGERQEPL